MIMLVSSLYLILPLCIANASPHFVKGIPWGATPLDHRKRWRGKRIFGDHKTYRGAGISIAMSVLVVLVQKLLFLQFQSISVLDYGALSFLQAVGIGVLFAASYIMIDLIKSFIKRRINLPEGSPWIPFDQIDLSVAALIALAIIHLPSWQYLVIIFFLSPVLVIVSNGIAYGVGIKKVWW